MIKIVESLENFPSEYYIDISLDDILAENNNMILRRRYIKVPNKIYKNQYTDDKKFRQQMNKFTSNVEHKMQHNFGAIVEHKLKSFINPDFKFTISNITFGSDKIVPDTQHICLAIYVHISVDMANLNVADSLIPKMKLFKIRFAEHTSKQELRSLSNPETLILNSMEVLNTRKHLIEHQVENILRSRYNLYEFLYNSEVTISSFDQIPDNIFNDCLKYKNKTFK